MNNNNNSNNYLQKYIYRLYNNTDTNSFLSYIIDDNTSSINYKHVNFNYIDGFLKLNQIEPSIITNTYIRYDGNSVQWSILDINNFGLLKLTNIDWLYDNLTTRYVRADGSCVFIKFNEITDLLSLNQI